MTVDDAADQLRELLAEAEFDFDNPSPELACQVFERFAELPVESSGGRDGEEIWFEADGGSPDDGFPGYFDFVRQFRQETEDEAEYDEQITAHFTCEPDVQLGLQESIYAQDFDDVASFFDEVRRSKSFRAGAAYSGWTFEVRVDAC